MPSNHLNKSRTRRRSCGSLPIAEQNSEDRRPLMKSISSLSEPNKMTDQFSSVNFISYPESSVKNNMNIAVNCGASNESLKDLWSGNMLTEEKQNIPSSSAARNTRSTGMVNVAINSSPSTRVRREPLVSLQLCYASPLTEKSLAKGASVEPSNYKDKTIIFDSPARNTRSSRRASLSGPVSSLPPRTKKITPRSRARNARTSSPDVVGRMYRMDIRSTSPRPQSGVSSPLGGRSKLHPCTPLGNISTSGSGSGRTTPSAPCLPRGILTSTKKNRKDIVVTTPDMLVERRTVIFHSPEAAEFNRGSPSMSLTPMCPKQRKKKYTIPK